MTATKEMKIKITEQELLNYCDSAMKEFIEEMGYPTGRDQVMPILTIFGFTAVLLKRMFPEERKRESKK